MAWPIMLHAELPPCLQTGSRAAHYHHRECLRKCTETLCFTVYNSSDIVHNECID